MGCLIKMKQELYNQEIENTPIVDLTLIKYLNASLESDNKYCRGWDYLKTHLTQELKDILLNNQYNNITYNSENIDFILNQLYTTDEINEIKKELIKQLGSFVFVWKDIKRELNKKQSEQELKEKLLNDGFIEVDFLKYKDEETEEEFKKRLQDYYKPLHNLKVICVFDRDKIGIMGSFTEKGEYEGKFYFDEQQNALGA